VTSTLIKTSLGVVGDELTDGLSEGEILGLSDGLSVGEILGLADGLSDGLTDG
jgi:hypothetical protein